MPIDVRGSETRRPGPPAATTLPAWPLVWLLAGYPLWWAVGFVDFAWVLFGTVMVLYLARAPGVRVPRGFGIWLAFLLWMTLSASQLDTFGRLLGFSYRYLIYAASTVIFLYLYNARHHLTDRVVCGLITLFWAISVVGGYLGMAFPTTVVRTPLSYVLPGALVDNELVNHMVIRRLAQYNPDGWFDVAPRPSAPFLYTNNWGNVYSLLLPFVVLYLLKSRGQRRFWVVLALIPLSFIPAAATLNRGMFLGLGVAAAYLSIRYLLLGNVKVLLAIATAGVVGVTAFGMTAWSDQIDDRVEDTSTTEDRAEIYAQTIVSVQDSPLLGMGAPRPSANPNIPPVGTHGQFWIVLHSHGVPGMLFFMGWFGAAFVAGLKRRDSLGLVANAALLVGLLETFYYGFLPVGLMMLMLIAALALRGPVGKGRSRHLAPSPPNRVALPTGGSSGGPA